MMRTEDWLKVEELLNAALELDPAGRRRLLDEVGGRAPELRREVESLLDCEEAADNFLAAPAIALSADFFDDDDHSAAGEDRAGQIVGPYRIVREIGRGGMGAVFLAERSDGEFRQQVALKVVRRSFADAELARRFRQERQILASLNHPHIARLLDGGVSADGEPYFAMEYVEGARIDDYCDAHKLPIRERLKLFLEVCQGVAYAHQHLVVHRDLKPSNILVGTDEQTGRPVPKLLDFGIAKLLDEDGGEGAGEYTRTGLRAFTPDYAAPEQVRGGRATTASDVYSLGVLLEDLLGGAPTPAGELAPGRWRSQTPGAKKKTTTPTNLPTNGAGRDEKLPTVGRRFVGAELRNIVAAARREEPQRRYPSVAQLAEDVGRYLDGRPVRAQTDSVTYRASKFVRRNKVAVAAALLVALSLVAGLAAALWQANVARRERDRAERRFSDVRQLSNALLFDVSPKIENLQGATEARRSVVTQSLKYLDSLANEVSDDPALQSELAAAYEKVGDLQGNPTNPNLGDLAGAIASYEKARTMRQRLLANAPGDFEQRRLLAANHQSLGNLRWQANELEESTKQTEAALSLYEKLAAERSDSAELRLALAEINFDTGDARKDNSKDAEAIAYFQKALALLEPLRRREPENVRLLKLAGNCHLKMGNSLSWSGRQKEGEAETQTAVRIYESLAANRPNDASVADGLWQTYWMASSTYEDVDNKLSHEYALKALKTAEAIVAKDAANAQGRKHLARTLSTLGQASTNTGRPAEAVAHLEKAVAETRRLLADDPASGGTKSSLGASLMRLAEARAKQKDFPGALAELDEAERIYAELLQADATDRYSLRNQAILYDFRAEIHSGWAKTVTGEKRRSHEQSAKANYAKTAEILRRLDALKSLPEADRKWLEKLQAGA